ncbi:MAG TPA: hypothetical protein VMH81_21410 [Bryobacteraceae bacterium]|nr:hypothetical protein [Bryobacteraceae bacterium]
MLKKFILAFAILALALATAGTVTNVLGSYKINIIQPSVVNGTDLKAGEYRLTVQPDKVTIFIGKEAVNIPVKIETAEKKFDSTAIRYTTVGGKSVVSEIRLGGTTTRLVFNP